MKIDFKDPDRSFGTNAEVVAKVVDAMKKISGARTIKSGGRIIKNAGLSIEVGPDKWKTEIRITDNQGRTIGWHSCGEIVSILAKKLEIIY